MAVREEWRDRGRLAVRVQDEGLIVAERGRPAVGEPPSEVATRFQGHRGGTAIRKRTGIVDDEPQVRPPSLPGNRLASMVVTRDINSAQAFAGIQIKLLDA